MPSIASVLKSEMVRVARKEVRGETLGLKKSVGTCRAEIAALKRTPVGKRPKKGVADEEARTPNGV